MASQEFKTHRVTELPAVLDAYAVYFVAPVGTTDYVEIYVTSSDGTSARRVINEQDVNTLVEQKLAGTDEIYVVDTIADRLTVDTAKSRYVYVVDASDDSTVTSGGASYLYNTVTKDWVKISESESMDLVLNWNSIIGGPTSTPAQIDEAVAAKHTHVNKNALDKVGEDVAGNFTYGGVAVSGGITQWATTNW